jgi:hypothetical protein
MINMRLRAGDTCTALSCCVRSFGIVLYILCNLGSPLVLDLASCHLFILIFFAPKGILYIIQYQNCVSLGMSLSCVEAALLFEKHCKK